VRPSINGIGKSRKDAEKCRILCETRSRILKCVFFLGVFCLSSLRREDASSVHLELINPGIAGRFNVDEMRELRPFHTYFVRIKRSPGTESTSIGFLPLMQYSCRDVKIAFGPSPGRLRYTSHVPKTFLCITASISKASRYSSIYLGGFFPSLYSEGVLIQFRTTHFHRTEYKNKLPERAHILISGQREELFPPPDKRNSTTQIHNGSRSSARNYRHIF
jgi:hypothetical protein